MKTNNTCFWFLLLWLTYNFVDSVPNDDDDPPVTNPIPGTDLDPNFDSLFQNALENAIEEIYCSIDPSEPQELIVTHEDIYNGNIFSVKTNYSNIRLWNLSNTFRDGPILLQKTKQNNAYFRVNLIVRNITITMNASSHLLQEDYPVNASGCIQFPAEINIVLKYNPDKYDDKFNTTVNRYSIQGFHLQLETPIPITKGKLSSASTIGMLGIVGNVVEDTTRLIVEKTDLKEFDSIIRKFLKKQQ